MLQVGLAIAGDLLLEAIERDLRTAHKLSVLRRESDLWQRACDFDVLVLDKRFSEYVHKLPSLLRNSGIGVVVISDSTSGPYIDRLLRSGVDAYLYRGDVLRPLTCPCGVDAALSSAFAKRHFLSPSAASAYSQLPYYLDADSEAVLHLLANDMRPSVIAKTLNVPRPHVYYLLNLLKAQLGVTTIAGVLMQAARLGYVEVRL